MNETEIEALKKGAAVLYTTLNNINLLHSPEQFTDENDEVIEGCSHCSAIADAIVHMPCPTMRLLLNDFEVEEANTPEE